MGKTRPAAGSLHEKTKLNEGKTFLRAVTHRDMDRSGCSSPDRPDRLGGCVGRAGMVMATRPFWVIPSEGGEEKMTIRRRGPRRARRVWWWWTKFSPEEVAGGVGEHDNRDRELASCGLAREGKEE